MTSFYYVSNNVTADRMPKYALDLEAKKKRTYRDPPSRLNGGIRHDVSLYFNNIEISSKLKDNA